MLIRAAKPVLREGDCLFASFRTRSFLLKPCAAAADAPLRGSELVDLLWGKTSGRVSFPIWCDTGLPDGVIAVCEEIDFREKGSYEIDYLHLSFARRHERATVILPDEVLADIGGEPEPPSSPRELKRSVVTSPQTRRYTWTAFFQPEYLREAWRAVDACIGEVLGNEDWAFGADHRTDAEIPDGVLAYCEDDELVVTFWFELPVVPLEDRRAWAGRLKAHRQQERERCGRLYELHQLVYGSDRLTVSQRIGDLIRAEEDRACTQ